MLVGEGGFEPPHACAHWHLKPACLPFHHSPLGGVLEVTEDTHEKASRRGIARLRGHPSPRTYGAGSSRAVANGAKHPLTGIIDGMGVARNLEKRLEGLLEGFFIRLFRSGLQPVEVGRRVLREMEEGRTVSINRIYAPNDFRISMGPEDYERFHGMEAGLVREFQELVLDQAKRNRWNLMGLPRFAFHEVPAMGKGEFKVEASLAADPEGRAPVVSTREPSADNLSATRAISSDTAERMGLGRAQAELVVLSPSGDAKERIALTRAPVTIGRQSTNDVVLSDPNVSRRHAELRRDGVRWVLVDLGSTNGSLVNGKLTREHEVAHGDRLAFGNSELIFETAREG